MKIPLLRLLLISLAMSFLTLKVIDGAVTQWIRIGAFQYRVTDSGQNSETTPGGNSLQYYGGSGSQTWRWWGMRYVALDTEDAFPPFADDPDSTGNGYMFAGTTYGSGDEETDQWAVGDTDPLVNTFTSYWRQQPPIVIVDGLQISPPFPYNGTDQQVDPSKIPGTADVLVVSTARNQMGLEIHHRVLSWSRADYDDFHIWEYNIVNTGNTDRDDEIEVNTTLEGLYLHRGPSLTGKMWTEWYGMCAEDTLRIWYQYPGGDNSSYPSDMGWISGGWGQPTTPSYLGQSEFIGELTLFAEDTSLNNQDEWAQPVVHFTAGPDHQPIKAYAHNTDAGLEPEDWDNIYDILAFGPMHPNSGYVVYCYVGPCDWRVVMMQDNPLFTLRGDAGDWHETPSAWRDDMSNAYDATWAAAAWSLQPHTSYGPYALAQGDTVTLVTAWVAGGISEQVARSYGEIVAAGFYGTGPGLEANTDFDWDNMPDPPINIRRPEMYTPSGEAADENIRRGAKLVYTGRDSLLMNAMAAKYAYDNNYDIPIPPPAPDLMVTSLGTGIRIEWDGWQSETASDFAGYRVYRAAGGVDSVWTMILEVSGTGTYTYLDEDVEQGIGYYYYVAAFDDGSEHPGDYFDPGGTSLESGMFLNRTTWPAAMNYGPIAADDEATAPSGQIIAIDVLANDSDSDGDDLSIISARSSHGAAAGDTILNYTSLPGFVGVDTITYIITDGVFSYYDTARVIVTVTEDDRDPPVQLARIYGGGDEDIGEAVKQTADGGYIILGSTRSFGAGRYDAWLIKTDPQGDTVWTRTYGGYADDRGYSIQQTSDEGYIITGETSSFGAGSSDLWLVKTNATGDTAWTRTYGGSINDIGYSVQQTADEGYVIAGCTGSISDYPLSAWVIKTDAQGDTLWTWVKADGDHFGRSVRQTSDGGYIIAGDRYDPNLDHVSWLVKMDSQGHTLWMKNIYGLGNSYAHTVQQIDDEGYIITGYFAPDSYDAWLVRTDAQGEIVWSTILGGDEDDYGYSIRQTADGGFIMVGETASSLPDNAAWLIRINADGDTVWTRTFGGIHSDRGRSVELTTDGGYLLVGTTNTFGTGGADILLIKVGSDTLLAIDGGPSALPQQLTLHQNYPNPFNPSTTLRFDLPVAMEVSLVVYDLLGREIARLVDDRREAGYHQVVWNGRDATGRELSTGIYIVRLVAPQGVKAIKLVMMK